MALSRELARMLAYKSKDTEETAAYSNQRLLEGLLRNEISLSYLEKTKIVIFWPVFLLLFYLLHYLRERMFDLTFN